MWRSSSRKKSSESSGFSNERICAFCLLFLSLNDFSSSSSSSRLKEYYCLLYKRTIIEKEKSALLSRAQSFVLSRRRRRSKRFLRKRFFLRSVNEFFLPFLFRVKEVSKNKTEFFLDSNSPLFLVSFEKKAQREENKILEKRAKFKSLSFCAQERENFA